MFTTDDIGQMMDYPDVTLILQVGLLADADAYKQRLRQTARCGKAGRAVLLLTQLESFWLDDNRQLPIQPYPASERILNDTSSADQIATVLKAVDEQKKQKAYTGFLGFMKGYLDRIQMNNAELVQMANIFALEGMQCEEVPGMYRKTIKRLGLRGVPGIVIAEPPEPDPDDLWW